MMLTIHLGELCELTVCVPGRAKVHAVRDALKRLEGL